MEDGLTEAQRHPELTQAGLERLRWLQQHPNAPKYNHRCGDRLEARGLTRVQAYGEQFRHSRRGWAWREIPPWLQDFASYCCAEVPYYRAYGIADFYSLPLLGRETLIREPWSLVPDSQPLDDLILYRSSQTSGECVTVLSHPEVAALDLPLLEGLLESQSVKLRGGSDRVPIVMVCAQTQTLTYPSVSAYLNGAGFVKLNLNPTDWRDPANCVQFLNECDPDLYSGDPIAFHELMALPLQRRPRALVSTAMTLLPGFRQALEHHFECPVFDLYALNETGIITADDGTGHQVWPHDLYVEILDAAGEPCPPGVWGEVVVSGGSNPFLPLLRYRTGDRGALEFEQPVPRLTRFEPRASVELHAADGRTVPDHHVTTALGDLPIAAFTLRQLEDGMLQLRARGVNLAQTALQERLRALFGSSQALTIEELPSPYDWGGKLLQYA